MELGLSAVPFLPLSHSFQECNLAGIGIANVPPLLSQALAYPAPELLASQVLLFARLLAERLANKGRPDLSQMINLLPRNRICSRFISLPVNVRPTLSPPRSPIF